VLESLVQRGLGMYTTIMPVSCGDLARAVPMDDRSEARALDVAVASVHEVGLR
jgi:hypothetical protein